MKSEVFRSEKLGTLTGEYEQAAVDQRETQERLRDDREPQEGKLFGGQTGGGTRRARTLANGERRLRAEVRLQVET